MNATEPSTTIVRHEREPMSGWIMAFMVMVVLVGLGFMSLMDLSSQQAKTERELFQLQQEFNKSRADAELNVIGTSRDQIYSQLNSDSSEIAGSSSSVKPGDELAAPFPIGADKAIEKLEGSASPVATGVPEVNPTPIPGETPVPGAVQ
jgi:hypothetical protein